MEACAGGSPPVSERPFSDAIRSRESTNSPQRLQLAASGAFSYPQLGQISLAVITMGLLLSSEDARCRFK